MRRRQPSAQTQRVMLALAADPDRWRYGYELGVEVGLKSGSLYPILMRLCDRTLVEARWEDDPPARPAAAAPVPADADRTRAGRDPAA